MSRQSPVRVGRIAMSIAITVPLIGCANTLVFVERTGFNASIAVRPSEALPLDVNLGIDRKVATIVPPSGQNTVGQQPTTEAVNMFAGFRTEYDPKTNPLTGTLTIRTQFASGAAATEIAGIPEAVARVVNVTGAVAHDPSFPAPDQTSRRRQVEQAIVDLTPSQKVRLANAMRANLASRPSAMQARLAPLANTPFADSPTGRQRAEIFLRIWIQMEDGMTPARTAEWQTAIAAAQAT